jgi:hypothetical protein
MRPTIREQVTYAITSVALCLPLAAEPVKRAKPLQDSAKQAVQKTTDVTSQRQQVDIRQGTVVYVSGNNLVVKFDDGRVKHLVVPNDQRFNIDGKAVPTRDLRPGTRLTQRNTTTTKDVMVTSVQNIDGTVRNVSPPYITAALADGTTRRIKLPDGTKLMIDGEPKTVFDLREGMKLKGTIVTRSPEMIMSSDSKVSGKAPRRWSRRPSWWVFLVVEEDEIVQRVHR